MKDTYPDCESGLLYGIGMISSAAVHSGTGRADGVYTSIKLPKTS